MTDFLGERRWLVTGQRHSERVVTFNALRRSGPVKMTALPKVCDLSFLIFSDQHVGGLDVACVGT